MGPEVSLPPTVTNRMPPNQDSSAPMQSHLTDKLVRGLGRMRRRNVLCDLALTCKGVEFTVHKCVLAASSEYFHAMFTNGLEETHSGQVELHEVDPDAMDVLLGIIYGEKAAAHLHEDQLEPVLSAAHMLQLDPIYEYCCEILAEKLTCCNYVQVWDLADKYSSSFLHERVLEFCIKNFRKIVQESEFLTMPFERLSILLASDDLNVPSEDVVLETVVSWLNADRESRHSLVQQLLSSVRFDLLSNDILKKVSARNPWTKDALKDFSCKDKPSTNQNCINGINNTKCRNSKPTEAVMVVFGENGESDVIMQCYSFLHEKWYSSRGLPIPMTKMGVASFQNLVYLIGGFDGNKCLQSLLIFDIVTGRFKCASAMKHKRCDSGVAILGGCIYVVGGFDGQEYLREVECYDLAQNTWRSVASIEQGRAGASVSAFNKLLYVIGGYDGKCKTERRLMECYSPETNQWTKVIDMNFGLWNAGVAVLDGCLYAVGGFKLNGDRKPSPSSSVLCFTSRDKSWKTIHQLPIVAVNTSVLTWDDRLYVMTPQGRFFAYDPCTDRWWELTKASNIKGELRGSYAAAVVVHKPI